MCLLPSSLVWGSHRMVPHFVSALVFMGKWNSLCTQYWQEQNEVGGYKWVSTALQDPYVSLAVEALKGERKRVCVQTDPRKIPQRQTRVSLLVCYGPCLLHAHTFASLWKKSELIHIMLFLMVSYVSRAYSFLIWEHHPAAQHKCHTIQCILGEPVYKIFWGHLVTAKVKGILL